MNTVSDLEGASNGHFRNCSFGTVAFTLTHEGCCLFHPRHTVVGLLAEVLIITEYPAAPSESWSDVLFVQTLPKPKWKLTSWMQWQQKQPQDGDWWSLMMLSWEIKLNTKCYIIKMSYLYLIILINQTNHFFSAGNEDESVLLRGFPEKQFPIIAYTDLQSYTSSHKSV